MSKAIRWKVPFQSINKVDYEVWIYDEGYSGTPDLVNAASTPFVTDEETDTNFFAPVRGSSGSLNIIDPDGTLMMDMLPSNNAARPVRLVKTVNSVQTIVWQGFLTCEAYSQGFQFIAQNVELQVASLLEAADSISANQSDFSGVISIRELIIKCISAIQSNMDSTDIFTTLYFPAADWQILNFKCDTSLFLDLKETQNENRVDHVVSGRSIKSILTSLCTFMGWCVRECPNRALAFQRLNDQDTRYLYISKADFVDTNKSLGTYLISGTKYEVDMEDFSYRGSDHEISTYAGAKSVEVISSLKSYELGTKFPEIPYGLLAVNPSSRWSTQGEIYAGPTNSQLDSNCVFRAMSGQYSIAEDLSDGSSFTLGSASSSQTYYQNTLWWVDNDFQTYYYDLVLNHTKFGTSPWYVMAFMAMYRDNNNNLQEGLMLYGATYALRYGDQQFWPFTGSSLTSTNYIFRQKALLPFTAYTGRIAIAINISQFIFLHKGAVLNMTYYTPSITIALQFGNKWAVKNGNTYGWSSSFNTIEVYFNSNGTIDLDNDELSIPITSYMTGDIYLYVYHRITGWGLYVYPGGVTDNYDPIIGMLISSIDISYVKPELSSKRGTNHYFQLLGTNFSSEKVVTNDMATDMDNNESPSILLYTLNDKMRYMTYNYLSGTTTNRPEKDLLARLAKYYKKKRRTIQVEVEQINNYLPITRVNEDNVQLQPLAETIDWALDKSTVTLMEESSDSET